MPTPIENLNIEIMTRIKNDWLTMPGPTPIFPQAVMEGLVRWVVYGPKATPGEFLGAVLTNDLMGACGRADHMNKYLLWEYAYILSNSVPAGCKGSPEICANWKGLAHPFWLIFDAQGAPKGRFNHDEEDPHDGVPREVWDTEEVFYDIYIDIGNNLIEWSPRIGPAAVFTTTYDSKTPEDIWAEFTTWQDGTHQ